MPNASAITFKVLEFGHLLLRRMALMIARLRAAFRPFFMVTSPQILRAKSEALQPRLSSFSCMLWTRAGPAVER